MVSVFSKADSMLGAMREHTFESLEDELKRMCPSTYQIALEEVNHALTAIPSYTKRERILMLLNFCRGYSRAD